MKDIAISRRPPLSILPISSISQSVKPKRKRRSTTKWYDLRNGTIKYKGEWKYGKPHGKGTMEFMAVESSSHSIYVGDFVNGMMNGYGIQVYDQDNEPYIPHYDGEFKNGLHHGKGEYHFGTGSYYKGEFFDGKFHGKGKKYFHDTDKTYIGVYFQDKWLRGEEFEGEI
jgi:hypothetical protein